MQEITIKNDITTLELLEQINFFRNDIEGKVELLHKDLLKIVRNEFEEEINEGKISPIFYKDSMNREKPMFNLTLSQAKQVLVRESKAVRKAVIKYIEELEEKIKNNVLPTTYKEALLELVKREEEKEQLQLTVAVQNQQIQELQSKAGYFDLVLQNDSLLTVSQIAKDYGYSATMFNKLLRDNKIQYKQGGIWLLYQKYAKCGYTQTKTQILREGKTKVHTYWTQKGRLFIYELLKGKGILPTIEQ